MSIHTHTLNRQSLGPDCSSTTSIPPSPPRPDRTRIWTLKLLLHFLSDHVYPTLPTPGNVCSDSIIRTQHLSLTSLQTCFQRPQRHIDSSHTRACLYLDSKCIVLCASAVTRRRCCCCCRCCGGAAGDRCSIFPLILYTSTMKLLCSRESASENGHRHRHTHSESPLPSVFY